MKKNLSFTAYIAFELRDKYCLFDKVKMMITENVSLCNYVCEDEIAELCFAFIIEQEPVQFTKISDTKSKHAICLYGKIPYEIFAAADDKKAVQLLCESYLAAILRIPLLKGMKKVHFQTQKLHDDLEIFFKENGFL